MTIPTSVQEEKKTNVFMRCRNDALKYTLKLDSPVDVMTKLRELKNNN